MDCASTVPGLGKDLLGVWRGNVIPVPKRFWRGISAWDAIYSAWDPGSRAKSRAKLISAWELSFGVGFTVGSAFRRGIRRGICFFGVGFVFRRGTRKSRAIIRRGRPSGDPCGARANARETRGDPRGA